MISTVALRIVAALLALASSTLAMAEDIEIFGPAPDTVIGAPNIIFILDNSANWARDAQKWTDANGNKITQGEAELSAISSVLGSIKKPVNVGIMMLTDRDQSLVGGYVRFGVRPMLEGEEGSDPSDANDKLRAILAKISAKVNDSEEKVAKDNYANAMYEAWLYITGAKSWASVPPKNNNDSENDKRDHPANTAQATAKQQGLNSGFAYQNAVQQARYNSPIGDDVCGSTYIVFIGNNRRSAPFEVLEDPDCKGNKCTKIKIGGMPVVPGVNDPAVTQLPLPEYSSVGSFVQTTWARYLYNRPDLLGSPPYDETDYQRAKAGAVVTYTIDALNDQPNPTFTNMMKSMAGAGGGEYFGVGDSEQLIDALTYILNSITAKDSAFAAVSLPVSVNQRGTFLNQVYLGVFRPDRLGFPIWPGNLKLYQIGIDDSTQPVRLFLADQFGRPASSADGFITPSATSLWTSPSSFWKKNYYGDSQGAGGISDAPDGDLVEKGGVAQQLRNKYAYDADPEGPKIGNRKVYTCIDPCTSDSSLSATPFDTAGDILTGNARREDIINWVRGENRIWVNPAGKIFEDNPSLKTQDVRGFVHGDVLHSRPAVINYGGAKGEEILYVFYGSNDGMFRAVRGGTETDEDAGQEVWAFIAPEHFGQLQRLYERDPVINYGTPRTPKPYFIDGSPTAYTVDANNDKKITVAGGDKAYLFLTMRRGGRFIYALDVTEPTAPKMLWKADFADFNELGQTWSDIRVGKINASSDPVLIFGLGYDAAGNDSVVATTNTQGRGVIVVNALTGSKIWSSADAVGNFGIAHSIAGGVAAVDSDRDGFVDRVIAADTGANVWRFNIDDPDTSKWTVSKVAELGTGVGSGARRFINAPDVVLATAQGPGWDTILIGSGDREQPFDTTIVNRFYMLKDNRAKNHVWATPLKETDLYDATSNLIQEGDTDQKAAAKLALAEKQGWYITLGEGEKVDGPSTTLSGTTFFGTNTPTDPVPGTCVSPLGDARAYAVSFIDAGATRDVNRDKKLDASDRSQNVGVGFPPPPVALQIEGEDGQLLQAVAFGTQIIQPPGEAFGRRFRSWWYQPIDR